MAFYNPISKARPHQLGEAFDILRAHLPGTVPVIFGRAAGRPDEAIRIVPLSEAQGDMADMATCVIVGTAETRLIERTGRQPIVYSPRFLRESVQ
jgi:precorrin-3B C17-methyltransferase